VLLFSETLGTKVLPNSSIVIKADTVDKTVTLLVPVAPAVVFPPSATPKPPPLPEVVPASPRSVTLVKLALVQAENAVVEAESSDLVAANTTKLSSRWVVIGI
jgi:hypothetical protein